jgi:hypothetical protein
MYPPASPPVSPSPFWAPRHPLRPGPRTPWRDAPRPWPLTGCEYMLWLSMFCGEARQGPLGLHWLVLVQGGCLNLLHVSMQNVGRSFLLSQFTSDRDFSVRSLKHAVVAGSDVEFPAPGMDYVVVCNSLCPGHVRRPTDRRSTGDRRVRSGRTRLGRPGRMVGRPGRTGRTPVDPLFSVYLQNQCAPGAVHYAYTLFPAI